MLHHTHTRLMPAACLAALLIGNLATARAQSPPPSPAPNLSLSANSRTAAQGYQGWPIILDLAVFHPQMFSTSTQISPLSISAQGGSWANTIQLIVTNSNGVIQNWPIHLATVVSGAITLDAMNLGTLDWFVAPSDTSTIAVGVYRVAAVMNTTSSAGATGWNGTTNSPSVSLQISAPPAPLTPERQEQQAELLAQYDYLAGNSVQAVADLNTFLNQQPNNVGALAFKGNLLEQMGQTANALAAYDQALTAFYDAYPGPLPEAPDALIIPQARLRSILLSQLGGRGTPQASIQLLGQGTQAAGVFFLDLQITNVGNDVAQNIVLNQLTFQTLSGTGQVMFNNILSPPFPVGTDFLPVNGSATIRVFVTVQGTVGDISVTENGTAADIFGTPTSFSQTQTVFLNGAGGNPLP